MLKLVSVALVAATAVAAPAWAGSSTAEANKAFVLSTYQALFGDHDLSVLDTAFTADYIQHNPSVPNGREGLRAALKSWGIESWPKKTVKFLRTAADGDLVWVYTVANLGSGDSAIVDIFRVQDRKIAEHWDVIQAIPATTVSGNSMTEDGQ